MNLLGEQTLLRIYLRSADQAPHTPTYERIIKAARKAGMAGATVLKGIMGYGTRGLIQPKIWSLTEQLPVIVEIVDSGQRITDFLVSIDPEMSRGLATLERASVLMYRHRSAGTEQKLELAPLVKPRSTLPKIMPRTNMQINEDGVLLRVFIGESDRFDGKPLHEAIVQAVRELGLAGATVLRGSEGFGANSVVHRAKLLEMSVDMPIIVEIVDTEAQINRLLPKLGSMVGEGMITMEYVVIVMYRHSDKGAGA